MYFEVTLASKTFMPMGIVGIQQQKMVSIDSFLRID